MRLVILKMNMKMKIEHIDTTQIDLGLEMGTNIVNFRSVSV